MIQYGMMHICLFLRVCKSLSGVSENAFEHPAGASEQTAGFGAKTSEHPNTNYKEKLNYPQSYAQYCAQHPNEKRQKRARTRAECITIPKRAHPNTPLTLWGAGGFRYPLPPKARPNCLQTRQGEKAARWCTVTYIEGESLMPNDVSSDLARFHPSYYYLRNLIVYGCI